MCIQAEKIALVKMVLETENSWTMTSIGKILSKENICDFWNDLSVGQKEEIEKASFEIASDDIIDYDLFMQNYR